MNQQEELVYLSELLLQASRWERSEGELLSGLELEVQDRMRRLTGIKTEDENGYVQSEISDTRKEQLHRVRAKYTSGKVRVRDPITGKQVWTDAALCEKQILGPNKFKWVLKVQEPPEDEHQCLSY